ncbi:MAG TPA: YqcC family protein [Blastocatellia bacterium]
MLSYEVAAAKIDGIEQEMRRVGLWQDQPLAPDKYNFKKAFGMDTMAYSQWLQFIFIPRVREIIATEGQFPTSSSVGAQAIREFDTQPDSERLVTLLYEFDRSINSEL